MIETIVGYYEGRRGKLVKTGPRQLNVTGPLSGVSMRIDAGTTPASSTALSTLSCPARGATFRLLSNSGTAVIQELAIAGG